MSALDQTHRTADRIRDELLTTLEELDRRRHRATDVRYQVQQHSGLVFGAAAALVGVAGLGFAVAHLRSRARSSLVFRDRVHALIRAWEHPGRVATRARERPLPAELFRRALLAFGGVLISRYASGLGQRVMPAKR